MSRAILVTDQADWEEIAANLGRETELALDTESNSLYVYRERVCLIQIGTREETFLLDPLAVDDLSSLGRLLDDPSIGKVLHGSDYDLRTLNRDYGFTMQGLFDTQVAARFLGSTSPNLASVLENSLGITIPKSRKMQTSDWGSRPLSSLAIEYAANDVAYLVEVAANLRERLLQVGRLAWVEEECQRLQKTKYSPPQPPEVTFLRVKGSDRLTPSELAILKELFLAREEAAARLDCPPFKVLSNEVLVRIAQSCSTSRAALLEGKGIAGLSSPVLRRWGTLIQAAIARGQQGPEYHRAPRERRERSWTPESRARLQRFKQWRTERGAALGLDPALLWPTPSLERWALHGVPHAGGGENHRPAVDEPEVRAWQRQEFEAELKGIARMPL
ncbi:MAG: ribonuclease D [Chloroflexi bacterium]|nr:ribonuclease D [Chloroflexota bacterium]